MTLGEKRIRTNFNPSNTSIVDTIKQDTAKLINLIDHVGEELPEDQERIRCIRLAQTAYEEAAMWAVKSATFGK